MLDNFSGIVDSTIQSIYSVGQFIKEELGKVKDSEIESKALNSLVSYVDKEAERMLVLDLSEIIPNSGFITEEDTIDDTDKEYIWIIDPLDGTTNFLRQIPHFSISVALKTGNKTVFGAVYDVMRDEMYSAGLGMGSFLNGKRIKVSGCEDFNEAIIATGFPYEKKSADELVNIIFRIIQSCRGVRRMGSAALDLVYVATGRFDAYYESNLNTWDIAAGVLIVQEAGGIVSDFTGGVNYSSGKEIVASTPLCHSTIVQLLDY